MEKHIRHDSMIQLGIEAREIVLESEETPEYFIYMEFDKSFTHGVFVFETSEDNITFREAARVDLREDEIEISYSMLPLRDLDKYIRVDVQQYDGRELDIRMDIEYENIVDYEALDAMDEAIIEDEARDRAELKRLLKELKK